MTSNAATTTDNPAALAATMLQRIREAEALATTTRQAFEAMITVAPEFKAMKEADDALQVARLAARTAMLGLPVLKTEEGEIGWQVKRTIIHSVKAVRDLAPTVAALVIKTPPMPLPSVDRVALERAVKAGIKAGNLAPDLLERLEAMAEVKTGEAWICKVAEPTTDPAPATEIPTDAEPF